MNFKEYLAEDSKLIKLKKALQDAEHKYKVSKEFYDVAVARGKDKEQIKIERENMENDELAMKDAKNDLKEYELEKGKYEL